MQSLTLINSFIHPSTDDPSTHSFIVTLHEQHKQET